MQLTLNPGVLPQGQLDNARPQDIGAWLCFVKEACEVYRVDPNFALAVALVEGGPGLNFGPSKGGTYFLPFGIHKDFGKKWKVNLANPYVNAWVGIRALRGVGSDPLKQRVRLKQYNAEWTFAYERAITACKKNIKNQGIFKDKQHGK